MIEAAALISRTESEAAPAIYAVAAGQHAGSLNAFRHRLARGAGTTHRIPLFTLLCHWSELVERLVKTGASDRIG